MHIPFRLGGKRQDINQNEVSIWEFLLTCPSSYSDICCVYAALPSLSPPPPLSIFQQPSHSFPKELSKQAFAEWKWQLTGQSSPSQIDSMPALILLRPALAFQLFFALTSVYYTSRANNYLVMKNWSNLAWVTGCIVYVCIAKINSTRRISDGYCIIGPPRRCSISRPKALPVVS